MAQPISAEPDPLLVSQLNGGSGEALTALFDRYADAVYNYCFRRTASWHVAEDATATVFLEAWRSRERMAAYDGSALPWLYGIANNVCGTSTRWVVCPRRGRQTTMPTGSSTGSTASAR